VVAFDEVAGINFKDHDGVQIMKDFMASGSFSRGRNRSAPVRRWCSWAIFNQGQSVESLVKTSHLLAPFPEAMIDSAFFDRFHAYVPGWEIPKMRPEFFTNQYGLIVDYLAEYLREMRKQSFADAIDKWFKLGNNLNQRDTIAVRRTTSGLLKLVCPNGEYTKESVRKCLEYALEARRRVKEQLKKIGGMEFYDVHFSYIDLEDGVERFVTVPEQSGGALVPEGRLNPGTLHTISMGSSARCLASTGWRSSPSPAPARPMCPAWPRVRRCGWRLTISRPIRPGQRLIKPGERDFHTHLVELQHSGAPAVAHAWPVSSRCARRPWPNRCSRNWR
jgi:ATP-dependent Lon protease